MQAVKWLLGATLAGGAIAGAMILARPTNAANATSGAAMPARTSNDVAANATAASPATNGALPTLATASPPSPTAAAGALPVASGGSSTRSFTIDVVTFAPWGSGPSELGHTLPSEGNPEAPMSLAVDDAGSVYVLDQVNERVQVFGAGGSLLRSIPIGSTTVQDLAIDEAGAGVVLLDRLRDQAVRFVDLAGVERKRVAVVGQGVSEGGAITALFAMRDGVWVEVEHRKLVRIATPSGDPDPVRPSLDGRPTGAGAPLLRATRDPSGAADVSAIATTRAGGFFTRVAFREPVLQLLALGDDARGGALVGAQLLREDPYPPYGIAAEGVTVVDLSSTGAELGRFDLPAPEGPEETFRTIAIAPSGDVFHLHVGRLGATIRRAR